MSKRRGGCGTFLLGVLTGFLSLVIVVVGGGFWAYHSLKIATVEKWINQEIGNEEFRNQSVKDLVDAIKEANASAEGLTFGFFDSKWGLIPDEIAGLNFSKLKTAIADVKFPDFGGVLSAITAKLTLEEVMELAGTSELPTSLAGLKSYTLDDMLGNNGGKGLTGILEEVKIGALLGVDETATEKPADVDSIVWMLKDYTLLGESGIQNMAEDLTLTDLSAMNIDFSSNEMLRSIASKQKADAEGNLLFTDDQKATYTWRAGALVTAEGTPADTSGFSVFPKADGEGVAVDGTGKLLYTDTAGKLYTYDAIDKVFLDDQGRRAELSGNRVRPLLYPISEMGDSINNLTLGELLGDQMPPALRSFKHTRLDNLGSLDVSGIYLTDILPEGTTSGILWELANIVGKAEIDVGAGPVSAETYREGDLVVYKVDETHYYVKEGETYRAYTPDPSKLTPLSYSAADIDTAVNELTLEQVLGTGSVPDMLSAFAHVKIKELSRQLSIDNIYLTDIVDQNASDVLQKLAGVQGRVTITTEGGERTVTLFRSADKRTVYGYDETGNAYYVKNGEVWEPAPAGFDGSELTPLSYSVAKVGDAMNEITLEDVLGTNNIPSLLESFRKTKIGDIGSTLSVSNIYLTDIASGTAESNVLFKIAKKQGHATVTVNGAPVDALLWRSKDKQTVYYETADGNLYLKEGDSYVPASGMTTAMLDPLSYSVENLSGAMDEMTVEELIGTGKLTGTFAFLNGETVKSLPDTLNNLKISQLGLDSGVFTLLANCPTEKYRDPLISDLPNAMAEAVQNSTLGELNTSGIISISTLNNNPTLAGKRISEVLDVVFDIENATLRELYELGILKTEPSPIIADKTLGEILRGTAA